MILPWNSTVFLPYNIIRLYPTAYNISFPILFFWYSLSIIPILLLSYFLCLLLTFYPPSTIFSFSHTVQSLYSIPPYPILSWHNCIHLTKTCRLMLLTQLCEPLIMQLVVEYLCEPAIRGTFQWRDTTDCWIEIVLRLFVRWNGNHIRWIRLIDCTEYRGT